MAVEAVAPAAARRRRGILTARPRPLAVVASVGLALALATTAWFALAAAARPSVLSPPTLRTHAPWLLGPLRGILDSETSIHVIHLQTGIAVGLGVLGLAWLIAWAAADALPYKVVFGAVGAAQALIVLGPPQPLTDVFNYVVYGRMALDGSNPYTHVPATSAHRDVAYALSNWHHLPSPYGPLFTLASAPLGLISAQAALVVWKAVVLGCALGTLALTASLARRYDRSPQRAIACVGLCPVTLIYGIGGLHNDGPSIVALLGATVLITRRESTPKGDAIAGALVVAAAGLKPSFAVVVPLIVLGARDRPAAFAGAAAAGAATLAVITLVFGGALPALSIQDRLVTPLSLPNLGGLGAGHGGADAGVRAAARDLLAVVTLAGIVAVAYRRRLAPAVIGLTLLAALLTVAWVMPWYLAWSLPFLALVPRARIMPVVVLLTVWLAVGAAPQLPKVLHAVNYYPTRTVTGLQNHDLETELVR
ncbi:MAG TPA: glycosyltransferase 87 family protein [Baekduia sp.]|uniref:glycosyltransferase 87 family protein n=1 Tax=Baekduia sp. TaxID=2600305 RepID=UPI002D79D17D|nr:glycosyltransferase 87 family protein [Baekduia sp.]HET6507468.1 glycosyltransferase 87 family protein [Baekduia sp.]